MKRRPIAVALIVMFVAIALFSLTLAAVRAAETAPQSGEPARIDPALEEDLRAKEAEQERARPAGLLPGTSGVGLPTSAVGPAEPLVCNGAVVQFEAGIPLDWTVANNVPTNPVVWSNLAGCGEADNYSGGSGDAACASSGLQGGGAGLYDTELWSNPIDLSGQIQAQVDYRVNYQNFGGADRLDLDVSTDGGATWMPVLSWNGDHPSGGLRVVGGEAVSVDLSAYAGQPSVLLRWHYYDPVGPETATDWYAQVDQVALTCSDTPANSIVLTKTVGVDPGLCATTGAISVAAGSEVTYCYAVENTGGITLGLHDLVDSELGILLDDFSLDLLPGASVWVTSSATINTTTVNSATWSAFNPGPTDVVSATDSAAVSVLLPEPLACNSGAVQFEAGIPLDWAVVNNVPSNPVNWSNVAGCGESGNFTGGSGDAACASSDLQGGGAGLYDTELWTNPIDLSGQAQIQLDYLANYQNFAGADDLDLDVSTDGGATWSTLLNWSEDHGSFRSSTGEAVSVNLNAYAGQSILLRWHYYDLVGGATSQDWYAQVDQVALVCSDAAPNSIVLTKTVGVDPGLCATTGTISVAAGSEVTYCYAVENTGGITLGLHDLVDSELGILLDDFSLDLLPGASVWVTSSATINTTTVNTATWSAFNPGPTDMVSAADSATVNVSLPEPLACNAAPVAFEGGIPLDWTVTDNSAGGGIVWTTTADPACAIANLTNGSGEAACADSDEAGSGAPAYDTDLISNPFDLPAGNTVLLTAAAYYRDVADAANDRMEVDLWDGGAWVNLLTWDEDHQPEDLLLDLSAYAGQSGLQVRFRYLGDGFDWYAQVDDVALSCSASNPAIVLTKTVGTDPGLCAATDNISVPAGTSVTYCYEVENSGDVALGLHDLTDDRLGVILDDFAFGLAPGATVFVTQSATINLTTINNATWTAFNNAAESASAVDSATVTVLAPDIDVSPLSLGASLLVGQQATRTLTIANDGFSNLDWAIHESLDDTPPVQGGPVVEYGSRAALGPAPRSEKYDLEAPAARYGAPLPLAGGTPAFGVDLQGDNVVSLMLESPGSLTPIAAATANYYGGDFLNGDFATLYTVENVASELVTINTATGAQTIVGPMARTTGHTWTGMAGDSSTGLMYASSTDCSASTLYTVNVATGATTALGAISGAPCLIDIAVSSSGAIYGLDIALDALIQINPGSLVGTTVGGIGFDASFAQGMDFDEATGTLYLAAFNLTSNAGELRSVDLSTGATTLLGPLGAGVGVEIDAFGIATVDLGCSPAEIPWASVAPTAGTTLPGGSDDATVTFDSTGLGEGSYTGSLCVTSNDPDEPLVQVPLELIVSAPVTGPAIELIKTAGTKAGLCGDSNDIVVAEGSNVYYCYTVRNSGTITMGVHDLVDSELGPLFAGLNFPLAPGMEISTVDLGLTFSDTLDFNTINTATWTAYNPGAESVSATATATVTVEPPMAVTLDRLESRQASALLPALALAALAAALASMAALRLGLVPRRQ